MRLRVDRQFRILLAALALTCLAGWLFKAHCTPGGWTGGEQYTTGCYSDAVPFWSGREIDTGKLPYLEARMEYPVLTGAAIWIEGAAVRVLFGRHADAAKFLGMVTLINALLAFIVFWLFRRAGMEASRLWAWALAPPLLLYLGHNWDMLAVALTVAAMLLARANRLTAAAAVTGLGVAAKLYPGLLLPLLGLAALFERERRWPQRLARAALVSAAAIGAWVVVNLPVALAAPENWSEFFRFSRERDSTAAATWDIVGNLGWGTLSVGDKNLLAAASFLIGAAAILCLGWTRHRDRPWLLFAPLLAWFMLTNKVYSPQYDLWLYPILLMTAPRLLPVALFAAADIAAYFAEFWLFAWMEGAWPGAPPPVLGCAAIARGAVMLWLIADALRFEPPAWLSRTASAPAAARTER